MYVNEDIVNNEDNDVVSKDMDDVCETHQVALTIL